MQPPTDDCVASGLGDPNTAAWCEQYSGSESPWSVPGCATVRALLSTGPSGASDWVGFEDIYHTAGGIIDLCNSRGPGGGRVITVWTAEWIAATSFSVPGQRRMSGVVPAPVSACRSCLDYECCSGGIKLPRSDCVIQILLYNNPTVTRMMEFVGDWCCARHSTLVDRTLEVDRRIVIPLPLLSDLS